jgi:hypothetical protein
MAAVKDRDEVELDVRQLEVRHEERVRKVDGRIVESQHQLSVSWPVPEAAPHTRSARMPLGVLRAAVERFASEAAAKGALRSADLEVLVLSGRLEGSWGGRIDF